MAIDHQIRPHSLAVFRILFGSLMAFAMLRFLANGWIDEFFLQPQFHFTYPGFGWIRPWPGAWMHAHVAALAVCAAGMALGFHYRFCTLLFFLGFTYLELIDRTLYLNHYYLVSLITGMMLFMPADAVWAVRPRPQQREWISPWPVRLLRFQFAIVYLFAGIAKLNADWLVEAQPMKIWLAARSDLPLLGPWLEMDGVAHAASWTGAVYDLTIPILLLLRRTRMAAFAAVVVFHLLTWLLFPIGMFPWIMIAGATLFFPPGWPLRQQGVAPAAASLPWAAKGILAGYVAIQFLVPLRSGMRQSDSAWTGQGFNWAWKVMIAEKRGHVTFHLHRADGRTVRINPADHLAPRQVAMMAQDPWMIRDFARHLARKHHATKVRVDAFAALNARPSQRLIDPHIDLASHPLPDGWIVPLRKSGDITSPIKSRALPAAVLPVAGPPPTR